MDQFFSTFPTTLIGWILTILFTACAVIYIFSKIRQNDMDVLRNANTDLRDSLADNDKRIVQLEGEVKELIGKVEVLEKKNRTLEDLVVTALKQYFFENPKVAATLKDIVLPQ